jgi:hypothetical protein
LDSVLFSGSLKAVSENDDDPLRPGETALKKIAHALLIKAGFNLEKINALFDDENPQEGDARHIFELMKQLGANRGVIFTRPWIPSELDSSAVKLDLPSATFDVCEMGLNRRPPVEVNDDLAKNTDDIGAPHLSASIIVAQNGGFSMSFPNTVATGFFSKYLSGPNRR